jgi:sirohydrochlorin cobaltochelatase
MPKDKALILLAHGSRAPETLGEMRDLASRTEALAEAAGVRVLGAFLSLAAPDLAAAVRDAAGGGAREIRILPLFMFSGKHVLGDIPDQVDSLRRDHPGLAITLLEPIGRHGDFAGFLLRAAGAA